MTQENDNLIRTLSKNAIRTFILRIDLIQNDNFDMINLAEELSSYFERTEKRQVSNFAINFTKGSSEITKLDAFDYVLVSEKKDLSLTFSHIQNSFWIEAHSYKNNAVYKEIIEVIFDKIKKNNYEVESKRIGLRYINEFNCDNIKLISKIFGKRLAYIVKNMLYEQNQSRAICVEEFNNDGFKLRLQYGVPNKFYPAPLSLYDLVLDIDSYFDAKSSIDEWGDVIENLNHTAYEKFREVIHENYLLKLK